MKYVKSWKTFFKYTNKHGQHEAGKVTCIEWDHMNGK